jgi:hypothetical protein
MSSVTERTGQAIPVQRPPSGDLAVPTAVAGAPPTTADPGLIGLPAFVVGAVALALVDVRFVPASAAGAAVPIIMTATSVGMLIAAIWAVRLGQGAVAGINGVFAGFWLSYAGLVLGLTHGWFGIAPADVARTQEAFLISWIVVVGLLTVASLRLPVLYTGLLALVELAFVLSLIATVNASTSMSKTAGWVVFAFSAVGAYAFVSAMNAATGGRPFPMGRPILR